MFVPNYKAFKGKSVSAKKIIALLDKIPGGSQKCTFFKKRLTLKLHKILTTKAISKIESFGGPSACPLQYLFYKACYEIKSLQMTVFYLKAVRGGESKLAMAKLSYNTV